MNSFDVKEEFYIDNYLRWFVESTGLDLYEN